MSLLYVPIYKNEAGDNFALPVTQEFNTKVSVGSHVEVKKGEEVIIAWGADALQWNEVDSIPESGTWKIATRTTNPATTEQAFLAMLQTNYEVVSTCCGTRNGTGGSGGGPSGTNGGRVQWNSGTGHGLTALAKNIQINFSAWDDTAPMGIYISGNMRIKWGSGVYFSYPDGVIAVRSFPSGSDGTVIISHDDTPTNLTVGDDAGGFRGVIAIDGASQIPPGLQVFQVSNGVTTLPTLPGTVKTVNLSNTSLNAGALNTFLDFLIAGGLHNGSLSMLTSPRSDANLTKINTLKGRGWFVQAWGVYPNL